MTAEATPAVHTLDEAADILRVRKSWLERQAASRAIPFTMLGGAYRFTSGHLAEIVRMHEKIPPRSLRRLNGPPHGVCHVPGSTRAACRQ